MQATLRTINNAQAEKPRTRPENDDDELFAFLKYANAGNARGSSRKTPRCETARAQSDHRVQWHLL